MLNRAGTDAAPGQRRRLPTRRSARSAAPRDYAQVLPSEQSALVSFVVTNRMGQDFKAPDAETIDRVLAELDEPVDDEHPDSSLTHETGWSLGAFPSGAVMWENVANHDASAPRHLAAVPRAEVRRLWHALAAGDITAVESQPWLPGYG